MISRFMWDDLSIQQQRMGDGGRRYRHHRRLCFQCKSALSLRAKLPHRMGLKRRDRGGIYLKVLRRQWQLGLRQSSHSCWYVGAAHPHSRQESMRVETLEDTTGNPKNLSVSQLLSQIFGGYNPWGDAQSRRNSVGSDSPGVWRSTHAQRPVHCAWRSGISARLQYKLPRR